MEKPIFAPSLMCMDITNTREEIDVLNEHCDRFHADIMDGHFVRNITLSADFIRAVKPIAKLPIDAHLMVTDPNQYIDSLVKAGADIISFHAETVLTDAFRTIRRIRDLGCKAGAAICPATPVSMMEHYLGLVDVVTVMTVDPGYAGSAFIPEMVAKVAEIERLRREKRYGFLIQCDGAIGAQTYKPLYDAGARAFVMGSKGLFIRDTALRDCCARMKREFSSATGVALSGGA